MNFPQNSMNLSCSSTFKPFKVCRDLEPTDVDGKPDGYHQCKNGKGHGDEHDGSEIEEAGRGTEARARRFEGGLHGRRIRGLGHADEDAMAFHGSVKSFTGAAKTLAI